MDTKLTFTLDPTGGVPFYKQIIIQVDLQVNPNTVARAYNELEIRGVVNTQQGSGTFINNKHVQLPEIEREKILAEISTGFITKAASYGFSIAEIVDYLGELEDKVR